MPTKSAEYRLSPKAREDIEAVWLYSLAAWSAEQADRYTDDLTAAFSGHSKIRDKQRTYTCRLSKAFSFATCDLLPRNKLRYRGYTGFTQPHVGITSLVGSTSINLGENPDLQLDALKAAGCDLLFKC